MTLVDLRKGPSSPGNRLSKVEENILLETLNSPEYVDKTPFYIVPALADKGIYLASESTCYRLLKKHKLNAHRGRSQVRKKRVPQEVPTAVEPNKIWSWDITYLKGSTRGHFYYLYMFMDIYSRKIVGWEIYERECTLLASDLLEKVIQKNSINPTGLKIHSDNGSPMRGSAMRYTMQKLGVVPSFSRPHVSNDNCYSEALFKTLKYLPHYPTRPFKNELEVRGWVGAFVSWYNERHLHSGIGFVTPSSRHEGRSKEILERRKLLYNEVRNRNPKRWTAQTRIWRTPESARLFGYRT